MCPKIVVKRIYDPPARTDGARVLVDRIWPRGVAKKSVALRLWAKDVAPSAELRKWFGHAPERWNEFRRRYRRELDAQGSAVTRLLEMAARERLTLLFAARDTQRNNAVALTEYLCELAAKQGVAIAEPSSPVCFAGAAEPAYLGFADRDELVAFLNESLETERAFIKLTARLCEETRDAADKMFLAGIRRDELKWRSLLLRVLRRLKAKPSARTGSLYEEAMGAANPPGRLAILKRGQERILRKLRNVLPKIQDDGIRADLAAMRAARERNIRLLRRDGRAKRRSGKRQ